MPTSTNNKQPSTNRARQMPISMKGNANAPRAAVASAQNTKPESSAFAGQATRRINASASSKTVRCEMSVIPVKLDQSPAEIYSSAGCSVDPSGSAVSIMLERSETFALREVVIGARLNETEPAFTTARIVNQWRVGEQLRIEVVFVTNEADDVLSKQNLIPRIDTENLTFRHGMSAEILSQWESIGVVRRYLVDRVLTCPDCLSIASVRNACAKCGSARYETDRLIHHFACAHVGEISSFEQSKDDGLSCPKCRATRLIAGTDFQYATGPLTCLDCHATGGQPVLYCMCHRCMKRFEPHAAMEYEVNGYHFERLELLDLVAASE